VKIRIQIRNEQPGSYLRELRNNFWVKIPKFFDADPASGMEKFGSRIWDTQKHSGSATLPVLYSDFWFLLSWH
jgi:hypothetical protein